jgi:hypothetical protein
VRTLPAILAVAFAASAAAAGAAEPATLPPPPPPAGPAEPLRPDTLGEAPVARAGDQAAPLHPDEAVSHWRAAVATGVAGKLGGARLESARENPKVLLYFGGQADGAWAEAIPRAARLRLRMFSGGESAIYLPSDGDAEAAYSLGPRELRFVVARVEAARHPALAIQTLAQLSTLPSLEGALSLAGDRMRLDYFVSPVEVAWVWYFGGAHISHVPGWPTETDQPAAASAARARYALLVSPAVILSAEGDLVKLWGKADLFASAEGSVGWQILRRQAALHLTARWSAFRRRGEVPDTAATESELVLLTTATLSY